MHYNLIITTYLNPVVDQDTKVDLIKLLRKLADLEQLYDAHTKKLDKLHLRPSNIPTTKQFYELSTNYKLLDRETQELLDPFIEVYDIDDNHKFVSVPEETKYYVIAPGDVEKVEELLKLPSLDHSEIEAIFDQFLDIYSKIISKLKEIFQGGATVDQYFGGKYYAKKTDVLIAFSIDDEEQNLYMMDYSVDEDIPNIYRVAWDKTLVRAIKACCFDETRIEFYSVY